MSLNVLKCPYCDKLLSSHRELRVHVGKNHHDKIDNFMDHYFGGRQIEVDFVTLMLRRALGGLTEDYFKQCGKDVNCPISNLDPTFLPYNAAVKVESEEVTEFLKSDIIWACTSCLACKDACTADMSPFEVISVLQNLSARIGYHFPKTYGKLDENVKSWGVIQQPVAVRTKTGNSYIRRDLGLPKLQKPQDLEAFSEALIQIAELRVIL